MRPWPKKKTTQGFSCPQCGVWTRVLETRGDVRRRECANLHRFLTQEIVLGPSNTESQQEKLNDDRNRGTEAAPEA